MMHAIIFILLLAIAFGVLLGYAAIKFKVKGNPLAEKIDALLPQTQCGQCSYPGCKPYAKAIADGEAEINRCPPGGEATIHALADLLDVEPLPLDQNQVQKPQLDSVVRIVEKDCIGCTLCIQACPVDAIVGASKQMHTVIESECTGCDLCIPPCPVDCIEIIPRQQTIQFYPWQKPNDDAINAPLHNSPKGDA